MFARGAVGPSASSKRKKFSIRGRCGRFPSDPTSWRVRAAEGCATSAARGSRPRCSPSRDSPSTKRSRPSARGSRARRETSCSHIAQRFFAWRFTRKSSQRLFAQRITRVYSSSPRRRIRPGGSVLCRVDPPGPREGRKAWKAFRGTPRILISHTLETRSSKKGPPEPGSPFSSEEPAHQPKRI